MRIEEDSVIVNGVKMIHQFIFIVKLKEGGWRLILSHNGRRLIGQSMSDHIR